MRFDRDRTVCMVRVARMFLPAVGWCWLVLVHTWFGWGTIGCTKRGMLVLSVVHWGRELGGFRVSDRVLKSGGYPGSAIWLAGRSLCSSWCSGLGSCCCFCINLLLNALNICAVRVYFFFLI